MIRFSGGQFKGCQMSSHEPPGLDVGLVERDEGRGRGDAFAHQKDVRPLQPEEHWGMTAKKKQKTGRKHHPGNV